MNKDEKLVRTSSSFKVSYYTLEVKTFENRLQAFEYANRKEDEGAKHVAVSEVITEVREKEIA